MLSLAHLKPFKSFILPSLVTLLLTSCASDVQDPGELDEEECPAGWCMPPEPEDAIDIEQKRNEDKRRQRLYKEG